MRSRPTRDMILRHCYALVLLLPAVARAQGASHDESLLWSWFGRCARPVRMAVELRVDGQLRERALIPLCHLRRADIEQRQYAARLGFRLRGGRTFQDEYPTTPAETVQGEIWQAGADPEAVILGVSFRVARRPTLLNTLYVLVPGRRRTATLDRGIVVTSYPVPAR